MVLSYFRNEDVPCRSSFAILKQIIYIFHNYSFINPNKTPFYRKRFLVIYYIKWWPKESTFFVVYRNLGGFRSSKLQSVNTQKENKNRLNVLRLVPSIFRSKQKKVEKNKLHTFTVPWQRALAEYRLKLNSGKQ